MGPVRRIGYGITHALLGLVILGPVLALLPAAIFDVEPVEHALPRASVFPIALTLYDPLLWTCVGNSLRAAGLIALGSVAIGLTLARLLSRWSFPGRTLLFVIVVLPAVIPPAFLALGLNHAIASGDHSIPGQPALATLLAGESRRWLAWYLAGIIQGAAVVVLSLSTLLKRLDPRREDAARMAGAGAQRAWWTLSWPVVRPEVASLWSLIFTLTIADPGPPLILGLRRSLGFQLTAITFREGAFPRAAATGLTILAITLVVRLLTQLWGRSGVWAENYHLRRGRTSDDHGAKAGPIHTAFLVSFCGGWAAVAWLPMLWLLLAASSATATERSHGFLGAFRNRLTAPSSVQMLTYTVVLGLIVGVVLFITSSRATRPSREGSARRWRATLSLIGSALPPLVVGIGVLALARTFDLLTMLAAAEGWPRLGNLTGTIARLLDPYATPVVPILIGTTLAAIPRVFLLRSGGSEGGLPYERRVDQAILIGAGRGRARALADRGGVFASVRRLTLVSLLAAASIAPAIVLCPTQEFLPAGPGIILLAEAGTEPRAQAAAIACLLSLVNLAALAWSGGGRLISLGRGDPPVADDPALAEIA